MSIDAKATVNAEDRKNAEHIADEIVASISSLYSSLSLPYDCWQTLHEIIVREMLYGDSIELCEDQLYIDAAIRCGLRIGKIEHK